MNTINFDTLKAAKSLQDAGFETRQAEAVVGMVTHALSEGLATKEDVRDLKSSVKADVRELESSVAADMRELQSSIDTDMRDLKSSIDALDARIDALEVRIDADMRDLKSSVKADVRDLQSSIDALDVKIDNGLKNVIQKLTILLGGIVIGSITLLGALSRVFPVLPAP